MQTKRDQRSSQIPFLAVYAGMCAIFAGWGALGIAGVDFAGLVGLGAIAQFALASVAFAGLIYFILQLGSGSVTRLRVNSSGLEFIKLNGKSLFVRWSDPALKVNLHHLEASPDGILPKRDARRAHPRWVDAWRPNHRFMALETTLPDAAVAPIVDAARAGGPTVDQVRVAYYWHSAPKSPGFLSWDVEGQVTAPHELNGVMTRIRGPSASPD